MWLKVNGNNLSQQALYCHLRMNITVAGGYLAKAKGLTKKFGENNIRIFLSLCICLGDIDIFMGSEVLDRIRSLKRADAVLDGVEFKKIRFLSQPTEMYPTQSCLSIHNIIYDRIATKVQVVLNKVKNTILFQFVVRSDSIKRGRVTTEMTMTDFALAVIESFDFDITRHAIVDSKYLSSPGGLNLLETYFDNDLALNLEALQDTPKGIETTQLISNTLDRVEKYVDR